MSLGSRDQIRFPLRIRALSVRPSRPSRARGSKHKSCTPLVPADIAMIVAVILRLLTAAWSRDYAAIALQPCLVLLKEQTSRATTSATPASDLPMTASGIDRQSVPGGMMGPARPIECLRVARRIPRSGQRHVRGWRSRRSPIRSWRLRSRSAQPTPRSSASGREASAWHVGSVRRACYARTLVIVTAAAAGRKCVQVEELGRPHCFRRVAGRTPRDGAAVLTCTRRRAS